jgi:hypothetical protein
LYETIRLTTRRLLGRAYERFWKLPGWLVLVYIGGGPDVGRERAVGVPGGGLASKVCGAVSFLFLKCVSNENPKTVRSLVARVE